MVELLPPDCFECLVSRGAVDRAGTRYREDPSNYAFLRQVQCFRLFRLTGLGEVLDRAIGGLGIDRAFVAGRLKRLPTIVRKLIRQPDMQLSRMADVIGFRVVCESLDATVRTATALQQCGLYQRTQDYCARPRKSGYRGYHITLRQQLQSPGQGSLLSFDVEVQVRSYYQHIWSLVSESFGEQVKEGGGPMETRDYLLRLSHSIAEHENTHRDEVQAPVPLLSATRELAVARVRDGSLTNFIEFRQEYGAAIAQLFQWEESMNGGAEETLLLVGVGDIKNLGLTHASFLGMTSIPLSDWMPKFRPISD